MDIVNFEFTRRGGGEGAVSTNIKDNEMNEVQEEIIVRNEQ